MRADYRAGQLCATVANYAGKVRSEDAPPARPDDFMPALAEGRRPVAEAANDGGPILLADKAAQSALIRQALFKQKE